MARFLLPLVALFLAQVIFGADVKYSNGTANEIELELNLTPHEMVLTQLKAKGISFYRIPIENEGFLFKKAGLPELPEIHRWLVVNSKAQYQIKVIPGKHKIYRDILLYPAQPDSIETASKRFKMNRLAYLKNVWYGSPQVALGKKAKLGELTLLPVTFSPAVYNPQKRELKIYQTLKIRMENLKSGGEDSALLISNFTSGQAKTLTLNGSEYIARFHSHRSIKAMLIVHSPILKQSALELAQLHQQEGDEINLIELKPGTSSEELKKLLVSQYQSTQMDAVLLLGDEAAIPIRSYGGQTGDLYYSLLSGSDQVSDVALGRIPAKTEIQGRIALNKIKTLLELKSKGFINKRVMLIAHREEYPGKYTKNMEKVRTNPNPRQLEFNTQYGGENAKSSTVVEEAQKGYAILNYRGHGSTGSWASWGRDGLSFSASNVRELPDSQNGLSFIFNVACYNGSIQNSSISLAERQLFPSEDEKTLQGAVSTFGATAPSMTETNHRFNLNLFEFLQTVEDISIGSVYTLANNKLTKDNGGSATSNTKMYLLFSDPLIAPLIK